MVSVNRFSSPASIWAKQLKQKANASRTANLFMAVTGEVFGSAALLEGFLVTEVQLELLFLGTEEAENFLLSIGFKQL